MPTVFENYTARFDLDLQRVDLRLWDTSGEILLAEVMRVFIVLLCYSKYKSGVLNVFQAKDPQTGGEVEQGPPKMYIVYVYNCICILYTKYILYM